ncbi:MAG TPA: hypothetical protein VFP93_05000 [Gammaproteobacteria bacterium]|nr:hypothetical protein [Gammaproteobacteria bacterium]
MHLLERMIRANISEQEFLKYFEMFAKCSDVNAQVAPNIFLIHLAIAHKKPLFLKALIKFGADIEALGLQNITPLQTAVALNDVESFKILVKAGANVQSLRFTEYISFADFFREKAANDEKGAAAPILFANTNKNVENKNASKTKNEKYEHDVSKLKSFCNKILNRPAKL